MDENGIGWGTVMTAVATVVGGLATAVVTLWKTGESKNARAIQTLEDRANDCEQDREDLRVRLRKLELQLGGDND